MLTAAQEKERARSSPCLLQPVSTIRMLLNLFHSQGNRALHQVNKCRDEGEFRVTDGDKPNHHVPSPAKMHLHAQQQVPGVSSGGVKAV